MNVKRIVLAIGLVVFMALLLTTQTTSAASDSGFSTKIIREPVNWTIAADACANLPAGVSLSGTGERYMVITTKTKPDGSTLVVYNDFVQGTAEDSNHNEYNWIYSNQDRHNSKGTSPLIRVNMTDMFELSGNGPINNFTVAFHWTWRYTPPETEWPPVHHYKPLYTLGDPFNCDPI